MSARAFLTLSGAAVIALVIALALIIARQVSAGQTIAAEGPMFPELSERLDDLGRLEIDAGRYALELELRDDIWVAVNFGDYPVSLEAVLQTVSSVAGMTRVEAKTDNPELYSYIGVDEVAPEAGGVHIAAYTTGGAEVMNAIFGFQSASIGFTRAGGTFVRPLDGDRTWLVDGVIMAPTFQQDWFETLLSIPGTEVASIAILAGDDVLVAAEKVDFNTANYELTFLAEAAGPAGSTANDAGFRAVTQGIVTTNFDQARPLDSVEFGPESRALIFTTITGLTLEVRLGEVDGEVWVAYNATAAEGSEATAIAAEIAARTERWAFRIPDYRISSLNRAVEDLITPPPENPAPGFNPAAPAAPAGP